MHGKLTCPFCDYETEVLPQPAECPHCETPLRYARDFAGAAPCDLHGRGMWRYRTFLPDVEPVTLGEGGTPLVPSLRLGEEMGVQLSFKFEGANPTGSFKDRGASVLLSVLRGFGVRKVADDSSGNAGAALAAYAARAGLGAVLFIPAHASEKKLSQIRAYGAKLVEVPGPRPNATEAVKAACRKDPQLVYASHNESPYFVAGLETVACELAEELGWRAPDHVVVPVGGGGLFLGIVYGFLKLFELGWIAKAPHVHAAQATACAPIVRAFEQRLAAPDAVPVGKTIAEGVSIPAPPRGREILAAIQRVEGIAVSVSEEDIMNAWRDLPKKEGIYIEPTSAVAVAGLSALVKRGVIRPGESVVVPLTGSGLKGAH